MKISSFNCAVKCFSAVLIKNVFHYILKKFTTHICLKIHVDTSKSTPGIREETDSCVVNVEDIEDSTFCSCLSAHFLNKSFPFLLEVLWTTELDEDLKL